MNHEWNSGLARVYGLAGGAKLERYKILSTSAAFGIQVYSTGQPNSTGVPAELSASASYVEDLDHATDLLTPARELHRLRWFNFGQVASARALEGAENRAEIAFNLGNVCYLMGELADAAAAFLLALEADPNFV